MKLLLTSGGIANSSIRKALIELLGKPIAQSKALCIPTALYASPYGSPPEGTWRFISGKDTPCPMVELGWKSVGVLELTALPSIDKTRWESWVREADVFLVNGGDAPYLCHWMRLSGMAALLPSLDDKVWVGLSAGSMVMTPRFGAAFIESKPPITGDDLGLGVVGFSIFPHLDYPGFADNTMAKAEEWASDLGCPAFAMDDQTAIKVQNGKVDVVSEGNWRFFPESCLIPGA